jgi:hypothetical protein
MNFSGIQTQGGDDMKGKFLRIGLILVLLLSLLALGAVTSGFFIAGEDDSYVPGKFCGEDDSYVPGKFCGEDDSYVPGKFC